VSSLYRCRARVGYRPFTTDQIILFDEKQIQELSVKLKWQPNLAFSNADASTPASVATNALSQSTCSVTVSDPYLTGLAWPALFDAASLYTQSNVAAANGILLPPCTDEQDPNVDKCYKYVDLDTNSDSSLLDNSAYLLISLWYDVKGTSFGTDFYFRVNGFSISHGTKYPSVTIRGVESRSIIFNQSLVNLTLDEGTEIEKVLKDLAEKQGFTTSFCANTNSEPDKKRVLPRSVRYKGVTLDEVIKKVLNSVNGQSLSLPIKEYANRISMCTRGEVNQGCSVFYLGRGLYEGYEISGQPDFTLKGLNAEVSSNKQNKDPYVSEPFKADTYFIGDVLPEKRKEAMKKVKKVTFPNLFEKVPKNISKTPAATGYVWKDISPISSNKSKGIQVTNQEASKLEKDGLNLFGIAPNGTTAISFLTGDVVEADEKNGRVLIKTKFALHICEKEGSQKCFYRPILQESTGLSSIKVKTKDKVEISQEIGTSTQEKPEFTRFFIIGHGTKEVTLNPKIVWDWAFPEAEIPKTEESAPASGKPESQAPAQQPSGGSQGTVVGRVGSTGKSTGPHLHAELGPFTNANGRGQPITTADVDPYVLIAGKPASIWKVYSPYGPRTGGFHYGLDIAGPGPGGENINGQPVSVTGGATIVETKKNWIGYGNAVIIKRPDGREMILAHLQDDSIPPNISGTSTSSGGGKSNSTIQGSPTTSGLTVETSFKGVPRSLRIIPGRTILSFITDYDAWVEDNRSVDIDPGIWIPNRYKNWFINECEYRWREGDMRVQIEGVTAWGPVSTRVPTFTNYLESMRKSGDMKQSKDYYDYIRSLGGLNWKTEDGKDSTEVGCPEAQELSEFLSQGSDSTSPANSNTSFPPANCQYTGTKYPASRVNAIINAAKSAGINTKAGFAGVVGNALVESGVALSPTAENPKSKAFGVFQWLGGRRQGLENYASKAGKSASNFGVQMERFVQELKGADFQGPATVQALNSTNDPARAATEFNRLFERAPGQKEMERQRYAQEIFSQLNCK
jgi:hypothetical protein